MHPLIIDRLAREHIATLHREARAEGLARAASAPTAATTRGEAARPARHRILGLHLMPHVSERGRLWRAITALLRPTGA